jgi:hypothetical protein
MSRDPVESNPGHYRVVMENERVRVLEYHDRVLFVELKEPAPGESNGRLGPTQG